MVAVDSSKGAWRDAGTDKPRAGTPLALPRFKAQAPSADRSNKPSTSTAVQPHANSTRSKTCSYPALPCLNLFCFPG
jgi:hypothetical protein